MSQELTKIESNLPVPSYFSDFQGKEGFENVKPEDLVLARLAICQDLTPQHKRTKPNYIEGLEIGELFNTVSEEVYGEKVEFIPLMKTDSRIYFKDIKEGGGILCRSFNGIDGGTIAPTCGECLNSQWSENNTKAPKCNQFMNFPILLVPTMEPLIFSFKSTALSAAQQWLSRMQYKSMRHNVPMYVQVWELSTKTQTRGQNEFFGPVLSQSKTHNGGWATREEAEYAAKQYAYLKTRRVIAHDEDTQDAQDATEAAPF